MLSKGSIPQQPHIYGAAAQHYRQGTAVANAETPPSWSPEMAHDPRYPYTLVEYQRDVSRWLSATKVNQERQGALLALAIGGAARTVVDDIPDDLLCSGGQADLGDGLGTVHRTGPQLLFHALYRKFPVSMEANMLRAGLEFFAFTPLAAENAQLMFLRFDTMLDRANSQAELGISFPFRTWMLLSLLRLPPKKWSEYLKDLGHRLPRNEQEYQHLQSAIVRENTLEQNVGDMRGIRQGGGGSNSGAYFGTPCSDPSNATGQPVPLYLCLGSPAHTGGQEQPHPAFLSEPECHSRP